MIEIRNLTKNFGNFRALDHLNLQIEDGEFFGLLGPNGAGKTTTIRILSTLLLADEGEIEINGRLLSRNCVELKKKISVVTQEYSLRHDMNIGEVMEYQGRLYHMPIPEIRRKSEELLKFCDLADHKEKKVRALSGGMKRKLMICRALLTEPEILLLDEPTAGMDAISRRQMWELLQRLNSQNLTILLTTHYIEEAQMLCDRVALLNQGKLDEVNTPKNMIGNLGSYALDYKQGEKLCTKYFHDREQAIKEMVQLGPEAFMRDTTLEDVFLNRVGKRLEER